MNGTGIEDSLNRLDTLTREEAWMAIADVRKMMHCIENNVVAVIGGAQNVFIQPSMPF
jgi:hypothetical protein